MALNTNKNLKTYYSIDEVANMFELNKSTLRYWQKECPQLKPKTGDNGVRMYTEKDIETLKVIFNLVKCEASSSPPHARCCRLTARERTKTRRCSNALFRCATS